MIVVCDSSFVNEQLMKTKKEEKKEYGNYRKINSLMELEVAFTLDARIQEADQQFVKKLFLAGTAIYLLQLCGKPVSCPPLVYGVKVEPCPEITSAIRLLEDCWSLPTYRSIG